MTVRLLINTQRFSVPAGRVESAHEQQPQFFLERLVGEQPAQIGDREAAAVAGNVRLDAQLQCGETQLVQAFRLGVDERRRRDVGRALPRQRARESARSWAARSGSPAVSASRPWLIRIPKRCVSRSSGPTSNWYPGERVFRTWPALSTMSRRSLRT